MASHRSCALARAVEGTTSDAGYGRARSEFHALDRNAYNQLVVALLLRRLMAKSDRGHTGKREDISANDS